MTVNNPTPSLPQVAVNDIGTEEELKIGRAHV